MAGGGIGIGAAFVMGIAVAAFVVRSLLVLAFRAEGMPRAAALVERWWVWTPLVAVVAIVFVLFGPAIGVLFSAAAAALLFLADHRVDVPFRREDP